MTAKRVIMANKKKVDPLPELFATEEEAGEFWDTHSAADYLELLEGADDEFALDTRVFEVRVSEEVFKELQKQAESSHQSLPKTVDTILRKELSLA